MSVHPASTVAASAVEARPAVGQYYGDAPGRLVAYAIDAVFLAAIVFVAAIVISAAAGPVVRFRSGGVTVSEGLAVANALVATVLSGLYFCLSWLYLHASPGQRLLGMRTGREADGSALSPAQATIRWALLGLPLGIAALLIAILPGAGDAAVDLIALAWYLVLLVTTARSRTKQGLHDRAAGTVVVKSGRPVPWDAPRRANDRVR